VKVLVPEEMPLDVDLPDAITIARFDPEGAIPEEHLDADVLVVGGMPMPQLQEAARRLGSLKYVQLLSAGYDYIDAAGFDDGVVVCNGRGLHDEPVAEHALALLLAAARTLPQAMDAQRDRRWARELGSGETRESPRRFTMLRGSRVLIWGYGSIGMALGQKLVALGAHVTGVARGERSVNGVRVVDSGTVDEELATTDALVLILPSTDATRGILDRDRIARLPAHAWVVNVGRGDAVDQGALVDALHARSIAGAALDVVTPEPLPQDSALWDAPNVLITPHIAGGRPRGADRLLARNLERLGRGEPLENTVRP